MKKPAQKSLFPKFGFTLIELLVVISIIGVLMGLLLVSYQGTRKSGRDGKRKADLEQIRSALEMYRTDSPDREYPNASEGNISGLSSYLSPDYIGLVPNDPLSGYYYRYQKLDLRRKYELCAYLETGGSAVSCDGAARTCGGANCNYKVTSP